MSNEFLLSIVTAEEKVFFGRVKKFRATCEYGELEILPNHSQLLTFVKPGPVWFLDSKGEVTNIVIFGGVLEVQPNETTVLADTVSRFEDIDEEKTKALRDKSLKILNDVSKLNSKIDLVEARKNLSIESAKLLFLKKLKGKKR